MPRDEVGSGRDETAEVETLEVFRSEIDSIDGQILDLLAERTAVVRKIGEIKRDEGMPVCVEAREQQLLDRIAELAKEKGLSGDDAREIFKSIIKSSRNEQEKRAS
jgi:chorismate mutase